ncbi:transmembrane protein, putative (macronuclear) [Tetrahymena thermophila SB210]|uniref:Transmembrane protein, putative n=1 Tax=Tetrahymena thermophila (strain SB210) TaxID=312017 RepID=Q23PY6_TETTS|nr:transmembrane protein, putative [Tetrahymena thermophila SB210]EAR98549.1 transmembrane protein, putative [Tetrahymena thermophila SB210]|eukprot:XP_001018794.1 transmembrane protein, putative [Tetrahymena thermophila SB210]
MTSSEEQVQDVLDDRVIYGRSENFERKRIRQQIRHSKSISATEKILMMLVLVGLAFLIFSSATMYFQNCWVVSSIPFYFGLLQFVLTFGIFIYNIKISKMQLWSYKLIGVMNILTAIISLIMYYVQFQSNILCSNAICHSNFTGAYIIENIPSDSKKCSNFDGLNSLQKSNSIFVLAQSSLQKICSSAEQQNNSKLNQYEQLENQNCNPQLKELYVFNQTGYFIGLMIVTSLFLLHGAVLLYKAFRIDKLKNNKGNYEQFSCQIFEGEVLSS